MQTVKMNEFGSESDVLVRAQLAACERVIRSGWWILGKEVSCFEEEWARRIGVPCAVGCGNGLDAIEIGLRALGIGTGDEVITTPMTAFATVLAVLRAGATPVLADIDSDTAILCPASVARCITARTKAILQVHLYGQMAAIDELRAIADAHGLHLLEDCAQAHGAEWQGRMAGAIGTFAAWSFYPTKNLGTVGDGGALTTSSAELAEIARALRNYGQTVRYEHPILGMNSRLDELHAAMLRERLSHLGEWTMRRRDIAHQYASQIENREVRVLPLPHDVKRHVHHLFVVTCNRRDDLQRHLKENNVESLVHYPVPIHSQVPCRDIDRDPHGLLSTERHASTCLSLPCHPGLSDEMVNHVIDVVNRFGVR